MPERRGAACRQRRAQQSSQHSLPHADPSSREQKRVRGRAASAASPCMCLVELCLPLSPGLPAPPPARWPSGLHTRLEPCDRRPLNLPQRKNVMNVFSFQHAESAGDDRAPPGATRGFGCRTGCGSPLHVRRPGGGEPARGVACPAPAEAEEGGARQQSTSPRIACQCPRRPSRHPRTACGWPAGAAVIAFCACAHLVAHRCVSPCAP